MCLLDNMYSRLGQIVTKILWRTKKIHIDTKVTAFFHCSNFFISGQGGTFEKHLPISNSGREGRMAQLPTGCRCVEEDSRIFSEYSCEEDRRIQAEYTVVAQTTAANHLG